MWKLNAENSAEVSSTIWIRHDGSPLLWDYDQRKLPSTEDPKFDAMTWDWLKAVGAELRPHAAPQGNLIAVQLNDETIYCTII